MKRRDLEVTVPRGRRHWYADYYDHRGRRYRYSLGVPADRPRREALRELNRRRYAVEHRYETIEIRKALDQVYAHIRNTRKPQTLERYETNCGHFLDFLKERHIKYLSALRPSHIAGFAAWYQEQGHKPGGVNSTLRNIRAALNLLDHWGHMPDGYSSRRWFARVWFTENTTHERILSPAELRVMFDDPLYGDIYESLYLTACRVGELLRIHSANIDGRIINLPYGKGGRVRKIPISDQLFDLLTRRKLLTDDPCYLYWRWPQGSPEDHVALKRAERLIHQRLQRILRNNDYKPARVHDIRATTLTHWATDGMPIAVLSRVAGLSMRILQRYYRQPIEEIKLPVLPAAVRRQ